jgi:hypothetical protein
MKLYSKHSKLMDFSCSLNDMSYWIENNSGQLLQELDYSIVGKSRDIRRQAFLDIEILGQNFLNKPFILKRNKDER